MNHTSGEFIGVGVGPGDPELITLKAARIIQQAQVIAYLCNEEGYSQARITASDVIDTREEEATEIPIVMPITIQRELTQRLYDQATSIILHRVLNGDSVVFLCEEDPLLFSPLAYLLHQLQQTSISHHCRIIPGVSSIHAASARIQQILTLPKETLVVMAGQQTEEALVDALNKHNSLVILKAESQRGKILQALARSQRMQEACYIEHISSANEKVTTQVEQLSLTPGTCPSLFLVTPNTSTRTILSEPL